MTNSSTRNRLVVRLLGEGNGGDEFWQFSPDEQIQIGRSSKSKIRLPAQKVSRLHATVAHDGSSWICCSVGRNGTFHEELPVGNIVVTDGMVLRFSESGPRLHFQLVGDQQSEFDASEDQSVMEWIDGLARGDEDAAKDLWEEYFERIVNLAKSRITARHRRIVDEEDVAVSVFESICDGIEAGKFPDLGSRDSLWRLLCVITKRKVARHVHHERRQKRGSGRVRGDSVFMDVDGPSGAVPAGFDQLGGSEDAYKFGLELAEQTEWIFEVLGDHELQQITELKLAGHTNEQIATELDCHVRTVKRRLQTIRSIIASALAQDE